MVKKYGDLYLQARRALLPTEGENAAAAARELLAFASGKSVASCAGGCRTCMPASRSKHDLSGYVNRMLAHEPLPYILGQWDFYGISLEVTPDVLIPRDDTMAVTDLALERAADRASVAARAGSLLRERLHRAGHRPSAAGCACDAGGYLSPGAGRGQAEYQAAEAHEPRDRAVGLDAKKPAPTFVGTLDALVCNPPYVTARGDDAAGALGAVTTSRRWRWTAGRTGWISTAPVAENFTRLIASGGYLCFEFGHGPA